MDIQQLKSFLETAKERNFSKAAHNLLRTQPAISLQVRSLEKELDLKLFERLGPKNIKLTPEGKSLFTLISPILFEFSTLKERFHESIGNSVKSRLKIVSNTATTNCLLPDVINIFKKKFPETELNILNLVKKDIFSILNKGEADIAIASISTTPKSIERTVFASFDRILVTTKKHPLSKKSRITLSDLAKHPFILTSDDTDITNVIKDVFIKNNLKYKVVMEVTGGKTLKTYVEMNMGISILNEYYLANKNTKNLFIKNVSSLFGKAEMSLLTRKNRYLSKQGREFKNILISEVNK